ncbi:MAG: hypothetical protein E7774_14365 [Bradyrhizobium sp.]|nr:MAG: hypothetical protein E7774_14365 [Bradyrhizobium sp.]
MRIRRFLAVLAAASLAFWAPSIIPVKALPIVTCGANQVQYRTVDTAYAFCGPMLTHGSPGHAPSPWAPVAVFVGTVSVMVNAAYIWNSQCRELSSREAATSTLLPFLGIAFDVQASKCRH